MATGGSCAMNGAIAPPQWRTSRPHVGGGNLFGRECLMCPASRVALARLPTWPWWRLAGVTFLSQRHIAPRGSGQSV